MNTKKTSSNEVLVSVVVVARDADATIRQCINSLCNQRQIERHEFEIIIVDDGSTDDTIAQALAVCPEVRIISNACQSISENRNVGWRASVGTYVAFIDSDCVACEDWLSELLKAIRNSNSCSNLAAVGGPNAPPLGVNHFYDSLSVALNTYLGSGGSTQGRVYDNLKTVNHLPGLNVLIKREVLEAIGGYDEAFARVAEDADLSKRLVDQGYTLLYQPLALVVHHQRSNLKEWASNMNTYGMGRRYLIKRHPGITSWPYWASCLSIPFLPLYSLLILLYSIFLATKNRCLGNTLMITAIFHCTHIPFSWGMIKGGIIRGDTAIAKRRWGQKKLYLMALKNAGNVGDEAIVVSATCRLSRQQAESLNIQIFGFGPSGVDIRTLPATPGQQMRLINTVLTASTGARTTGLRALVSFTKLWVLFESRTALVVCGGQWFHDLRMSNHILITGLFALARFFGATTGVLGVGIGPLKHSVSRKLMRLAFSRRSYLMVRDEKSRQLLGDCGLDNAFVGADLAFELPIDAKRRSNSQARARPRLGISPCAWGSFENLYQRDNESVNGTLLELSNATREAVKRGFDVVFLPSMNPEDYEFASQIKSKSGEHHCVLLDTREMTPIEFQHEIEKLDCLLSMRLHPLIFAFNTNTPFVAFNYAEKVVQFVTQVNQMHVLIDMQSPGWGIRALECVASAPEHESSTNVDLKEGIRSLLDNSYRHFDKWLAV